MLLNLRTDGTLPSIRGKLVGAVLGAAFAFACMLSTSAIAQQGQFVAKPLVEKKVNELPNGELYWRIDTFASRGLAEQVAGPFSLVAETLGKTWMFTLDRAGENAPGGTKIAEIGPIARISAKEYLLRVNEAGGPEGSATAVHTHPGSEAFYVISGELTQKTPHGITKAATGQGVVGHGADTPMVVSNSGSGDLREFALFVVDASRPFNSPAKMD
jgi:hypothetical protein